MICHRFRVILAVLLTLAAAGRSLAEENPSRGSATVGSKAFTESVILGEMLKLLGEQQNIDVDHRHNVGGTRILWEALRSGQLDAYPEYTGTLGEEIFSSRDIEGIDALRAEVQANGIRMTAPLGFNNTYVLGMRESRAKELNIRTIGDLRNHPDLVLRFSNEFLKRADGWQALAAAYKLPQRDVRGLEHALAYQAINVGTIDVTDLYATDAKIDKLGLRRLDDDLGHFPAYEAVFLYRADLQERFPAWVASLHRLEGRISARRMTQLNAAVELDGRAESQVASDALADLLDVDVDVHPPSVVRKILTYTLEHLNMVSVSLLAATLLALPLGILAAKVDKLAQPILGITGIIQTIPAIALLVMLIRPISYISDDLGYPQAVVALFLYSLLPIVRNTFTGLQGITPSLRESAVALGLPWHVRLWRIELPLASRTILAGIKTAAVINVGFATLGGFIGAGGYGDPIFTGIRLNNYGVIMQGAIPAAALALVVQGLFELLERAIVPAGLRLRPVE